MGESFNESVDGQQKLSESDGFVHLHVHTQYSLLSGCIRVKPLMEKVKQMGMGAVAITDRDNLFGAVSFYLAAQAAGIRPLLGCQVSYIYERRAPAKQARALQDDRKIKLESFELILLCKDFRGYQNLCRLVTRAYQEASGTDAKGKPVVDKPLVTWSNLNQHGDGLIVLNGGLKSELAYHILQGEDSLAEEVAGRFQQRFKDDFYFELQGIGLPEQEQVNQVLYQLGQRIKVESVATSASHYLEQKDAEAQEVLQSIALGKKLDFDRPQSLVPKDFYLKTPQEMREQFKGYPGACENTLRVAEKCAVEFKFKDEDGRPIYHLPNFRPDDAQADYDPNDYFRKQARAGLEQRFTEKNFENKRQASDWEEKKQVYFKRLDGELEMIIGTGFAGYFLIVADFINWAKAKEIPVGPGRGSGAGSLVAYSLRITDLDPIELNLLFERFINPERISMPDFDVDFCQDRRDEVIEYVGKKYGNENVCQIITYGKLQPRAVIKDVGRVLGLSFGESDQITKLLPNELNLTLSKAMAMEPQLNDRMAADPKFAKLMEYAFALEGLYRNAGVHAAGVIITEKPIVSYCPLYIMGDGTTVVQFDKDDSEKIGLVKFDFLGLKTLTVIDNAIRLVKKVNPNSNFELDQLDYNDAKVFELIGSGDTDGVFQVESSGMKDLCSRLQPNSIEDLTAINALYRPGPLGSGMVDDFIDRKHGRMSIEYDVPQLESILKDTYGVILYQEQVMQIARELAGYSLGQADMLRRAMGKKKVEEMARHREIFLLGATKRGLDKPKAEGIFDLMAKFAEYGFNKSHSAAYAVLTYQTAYLKAHYPAEFMAALMTTEMSNTDKLAKYISDARAHGTAVLKPDVNKSDVKFGVESGKSPDGKVVKSVRFGLGAIKGVGGIAADTIIAGRKKEEFKDVVDFCTKLSTRKVNKKVLESLTLAGALDSISDVNRATLFASLEGILEHAADEQAERDLGQASLFDSFSAEEVKLVTPSGSLFKAQEDWPMSKKLSMEKKVVGFYVSGHPMDAWQSISESWLGWSTERLAEYAKKQGAVPAAAPAAGGRYQRPRRKEIKLAGVMTSMKEITTRKGSRMAFADLEDLRGKVELIFFPEAYTEQGERLKQALAEAEPVIVTGEIEVKDEVGKIFVRTLEWAKNAHQGQAKRVVLRLDLETIQAEQLRDLKREFLNHPGKCPVTIVFSHPQFATKVTLPQNVSVVGTPKMVASVNEIFGRPVVQLQQ